MGKYPVIPEKESDLLLRMEELGIREEDLVEHFIRGSGPGGQKKNKTSSCVQLRHAPSGIEVKCQKSRSQSLNRYLARRLLCEELQARILGRKSLRRQEEERKRRQKRRRTRRQKERMRHAKKKRGEIKRLRKTFPDES